ncbi:COG3904 family protein [Ochrobactrum chromiisoli]|uniref:Periplasmic protein-like protein n=1 Tax=Ochrobactrum chromiisoli TaxID=2993941 RepID=A0ABT3QKN6_9HYPH|nr:hypothetical protein [Ochrobactrum chromiisoli]MCX2696155.1 hypothetical protein [Ochrobactrum chromiisoli]
MHQIIWFLCAVFGFVSSASAMDVRIDKSNGPMGPSIGVHLTGPIVTGDAEKVWNAVRQSNIEQPGTNIHVMLSSPGGSLQEGLELGRLLASLPKILPITVSSAVSENGHASDCASACVLIYLGATFRFLDPSSRIGVHQFAFDNASGIEATTATSISQLLSAEVTEYLREVNVDTKLFSFMSKTNPEEIHWVDHEILKNLGVLNEFVYDESSEYKNADGQYYLLLRQQSYFGENKIIAACEKGDMVFIAYLQPPRLDVIAETEHELTVIADGHEFRPTFYEKPTPTARFSSSLFELDQQQLQRLINARSVGARMKIPGDSLFFGFEMVLKDTKLKDTISGCSKH